MTLRTDNFSRYICFFSLLPRPKYLKMQVTHSSNLDGVFVLWETFQDDYLVWNFASLSLLFVPIHMQLSV